LFLGQFVKIHLLKECMILYISIPTGQTLNHSALVQGTFVFLSDPIRGDVHDATQHTHRLFPFSFGTHFKIFDRAHSQKWVSTYCGRSISSRLLLELVCNFQQIL
jgi:hypothetical protein